MRSSRRSAEAVLTSAWRRRGPLALALLPVALIFATLAGLRRAVYRAGWLRAERLPVAVIVVGNITAGGAGKTPLVIRLVQDLRAAGRRPGVVSRGYGREDDAVAEVSRDGTPARCGDEPLLIRRRGDCPVFVGRDRAAAGRALLAAHPDCDVIVSDDGLQHYALARDVEIAVLDARGLMNGWPLPAGPLREPAARLGTVDALVLNGLDGPAAAPTPAAVFVMALEGQTAYRHDDPAVTRALVSLAGTRLHAVAGIGDPERFFAGLRVLGLNCEEHPFPDHHAYDAAELDFAGDGILTTEKDAVKFPPHLHLPVWVLPVDARIEPDLAKFVLERLHGRPTA